MRLDLASIPQLARNLGRVIELRGGKGATPHLHLDREAERNGH